MCPHSSCQNLCHHLDIESYLDLIYKGSHTMCLIFFKRFMIFEVLAQKTYRFRKWQWHFSLTCFVTLHSTLTSTPLGTFPLRYARSSDTDSNGFTSLKYLTLLGLCQTSKCTLCIRMECEGLQQTHYLIGIHPVMRYNNDKHALIGTLDR